MAGRDGLVSFDMPNVCGELGDEREVSLLSWRPGGGGGHDQCQRLMVRVDDELSSLDHVSEVFNSFLDPEELFVEGGVLLLCSGQLSGEKSQRSCLLYTSPSPRDKRQSRMPSSA